MNIMNNDTFLTSNIIDENITRKIISKTMNKICNCLKRSLGPYGANSILEDATRMHTITKDGYTIFDKIKFDNEVSQTVLDILKKVSRKLVTEVGDGSTSSVIIATKMYELSLKLMVEYKISPKALVESINIVSLVVEDILKESAVKITEENISKLEDIATISNNNDRFLGKLVSEVCQKVGSDGFITPEINKKGSKSYYEIENGYEFEYGYVGQIYANTPNKINFECENPYILVCNDSIDETDLESISNLWGSVISKQEALIVVAKDYDSSVLNFFKSNKVMHTEFNICPITVPLSNDYHRASLMDFVIYTGGVMWDKYYSNMSCPKDINTLGRCKKVKITDNSSQFIEGIHKEDEYTARIDSLVEEINNLKANEKIDETRIYNLEHRKAKMMCKTATIYAGGETLLEKENRKFLLEDSIYSCRSALRNGYVIGGNLAIPIILANKGYIFKVIDKSTDRIKLLTMMNDNDAIIFIRDILTKVIKPSFEFSFYNVMNNLFADEDFINNTIDKCVSPLEPVPTIYNMYTFRRESFELTSIINSVSTDIEILKACNSIVGLLISSNQFICKTTISEEKMNKYISLIDTENKGFFMEYCNNNLKPV